MSLKNLQPFQVHPDRVEEQEIDNLVNKVSSNSKVSEIQGIFDRNISLCAYLLKQAYIDYQKIYFLSTSLIIDEDKRPDYICACYHPKKGLSWYAIICAGPQEQTWDNDLHLTPGAKLAFDRLNYCTGNLERILTNNKLAEEVNPDRIHGLLIIGQDKEFFQNPKKQDRKRDINQNSPVKLRTYGAFLRKFSKPKNQSWLISKLGNFLNR